ncbi:TonB-dependent receptor plug domain-containing protein [Niabella sp. W65]|nr:TonB-dependent receptor plug domain-containing protein [Niabella sp. W65]MCH7365617.1 TonB-dependent receptor plug domain-containing protein [Niabella sp. W65]ULT41390.1 TonB-dependent receptor plug domain-containing protein [Niabella sp. I65]
MANTSTVLTVSYAGYVTREVNVGSETNLHILLTSTSGNLNEVVVIGYGTQRKKSVTGSVASVNYDQFKDRSFSNVVQSLTGTVPGVNISQSQGAPGVAPVIQIRVSALLRRVPILYSW